MIINTNMASLNTIRQLGINEKNTQSALAKLSSGLRINSAADDAAGLAISEKMRGQIAGLNKATSNAQDGISLISTAEGSLNETTSILQRMRELAVQGSNDTNTTTDRTAIQTEMNQLTSEINRIGNTTEFNTQKLLKGKDVAVVSTAQTVATTTAGVAGVVTGTTSDLTVNAKSVVAVASTATVQGNTAAATGTVGSTAQTTNSVAGAKAVASLSNGITVKSVATDGTMNGATIKISQQANLTGVASAISVTGSGATTVIDFQIGTGADGKSLFTGDDRGSLVNFLKNNMPNSAAFPATITLVDPTGEASAEKLVGFQSASAIATAQTYSTGTMSGGVTETLGVNKFTITDKMEEAGDTVTVGGKTFTATIGVADVSKGEFNISATHAKATSAGTIAPASNVSLTKAVWNSGVITTMGAGESNTLTFGGVAVTINTGAAAIAASASSNTAASVTMLNGATAQDTATALKAAFEAARDYNGGGGPLAGYTFSDAGAALTITASEARGATDNAFKMVKGGAGALAVANDSKDATDVANTDGISSQYDITVNGTAYSLKNAELSQIDGTKNIDQLAAIIGSAQSAGSVALSTVADITFNSTGNLVITAKTAGAGTSISFTDAVGADAASINGILGTNAGATKVAGAATGATADDQAASLRVAINANATLKARFTASGSATLGQVVMTEKAGQATGAALAQVTLAGGGANDKLTVTDASGRNLKTVTIQKAGGDTLAVSGTGGNLTISLADTSAYKNTAAEIQAKVQALGTVGGVDFSKYTFKAEGDWDTKATGDNIIKANATLVGGTQEVKGDYSFDITKAFAVGDKVQIKGQTFSAVASGAIGSKGEFDISGGDVNLQAASLRDAISLNSTLKAVYTAGGTGATVALIEKAASGTDLKTTDLAVKATGTAGEYSVNVSDLLENGAAFILDGKEITVSAKNANVGYDKGTAIKVADSVATQTSALAAAINKNADLKDKYTASVGADGSLVIKQNDLQESAVAPTVATKNSSVGDFNAKLQIGANTGQTMTLEVADMRSLALGISGDGSTSTVAAANGAVASYVATANVSNGTDNTNVEFALDISTADKATAAISIIDDATAAVSAERSKLGAYQNRLEHTINNLGTSSQNITTAEANIRDVDMAKEMTNFQKNNILQQAAQAMLAQANQQPQGVLQLLR